MKGKIVRTLLSVALALVIAAAAFTAGYFTRKLTQGRELSSLEWALKTIDDNYYFGGVPDNASDITIGALADDYLDMYSEYFSAEEYAAQQRSNSGAKSGIGLSYSFVDGKGIYVASVIGNSPAYRSGLRRGQWLTGGSLGGEVQEFKSANDFAKLISGAKDGEDITLSSVGGETFVTCKAEYTASYAYLATSSTAWVFKDAADGGLALYEQPEEKIEYLPDGAGYVALSQFYGTAANEFAALTEKFNSIGCTSLIIDLRSNGGGYVSVMQAIAGIFSDGEKKPAMYSRDKHGNEDTYYCVPAPENRRVKKDVPVYVLANSGTASASEALIGALVCYGALKYENIYISDYSEEYMNWLSSTSQQKKTARTYGKGIMQSTFVNDKTGEALKLTTAQIFWPDGKTSIHDRGLSAADGCKTVKAYWQHTIPDSELQTVVNTIYG